MHLNRSILIAGFLTTIGAGVGAQQICNGNAALCNRKWSNVSQIGDHDSAFVGTFVTDNQGVSVQDQLNGGIRFLQGQLHEFLGELWFCHTSCFEEISETLVSYLTTVRTFLDDNPNEVITLLLTNGDNVAINEWGNDFVSSGITKYAFSPPSPTQALTIDQWPTLGELIGDGTRLITFMDYGADPTNVSYILDEFTYFFETPYDTTDPTFPQCTIDRPPGASASGRMYIVNHFLDINVLSTGVDIPDYAHENITNAATGVGSIGAQAGLCEGLYGRPPNFVLIDYSNFGQWQLAQNTLNGF